MTKTHAGVISVTISAHRPKTSLNLSYAVLGGSGADLYGYDRFHLLVLGAPGADVGPGPTYGYLTVAFCGETILRGGPY